MTAWGVTFTAIAVAGAVLPGPLAFMALGITITAAVAALAAHVVETNRTIGGGR